MAADKLKNLHLSKSDFKIAQSCPTKLYYKKMGFPSTNDNEYMALLAEGGYMVGKLAQLLFPEGIEVKTQKGTRYAVDETKELLKQDKVTLFEPAIESEGKIIRIDILVKDGNHFDLIEVKSKSYDSSEDNPFYKKKGGFDPDWIDYLEDVTFQNLVLKEAYPNANITPYLMMPDKAKCTNLEGMIGWFNLRLENVSSSGFKNYVVDFNGDQKALLNDDIMSKVDVSKAADQLMDSVRERSEEYVASLTNGLKKISTVLNKECKKCEFRCDEDKSKSGYHECLGELAYTEPHIFDLYQMGNLREDYVNTMLQKGKSSMYDVPEEFLKKADGEWGSFGERRRIQIEYTKKNQEWIDPKFKEVMQSWKYPLHFIDFETSRMAIPYHKGMRPYEQIAFQWSCHTIKAPYADPIHSEWINIEERFPSFEFAEKLKNQIGINGTVFMWSHHENTTLKDIFGQMEKYNYIDHDLRNWILLMAKFGKDEDYTMIDMCKLTREHYFHPAMKGSNSLKAVLPAVWNNNSYLHEIPYLKQYVHYENAKVLNPYKTLEKIDIADKAEVIREGTGAMRAYQEMIFGLSAKDPAIRQNWKNLLLQYCKLDTMAMVIVWLHWKKLLGAR